MHLAIDFGTCFSSAGILTGEQFRPVRDSSGGGSQLTFPSAIFLSDEGKMLIGTQAKNQARKNPSRFRQEFKRDLGSDTPYLLGDREFLPQDLIAEVLMSIKSAAETGFGMTLTEAVLTVPASYDSHRRDLMRAAGVKAGFAADNVHLLDEPEAAALYYDWQLHQQGSAIPEGATVLVYDLGGGTFDAALMRKEGQRFRSLAPPVGEAHCGGIDFDRAVYGQVLMAAGDDLRELLAPGNTSTAALRMKQQIADYCCSVKHQLTSLRQVDDVLPTQDAEDFVLTQAVFEQKIAPHIEKTLQLSEQLVSSSGLSWDNVDGILLIGGSSRVPFVGAQLSERFSRPLWQVEDPKLAVCMGAALPIAPPQQEPRSREVRASLLSLWTNDEGKPDASKKPSLQDIQTALDAGDDVNSTDIDGNTLLHFAAKTLDTECIKVALQHGADPNVLNKGNDTPLSIAACSSQSQGAVRILLQSNASASTVNNWGSTPIHVAIQRGNSQVVRLLLEAGVDPNLMDGSGNTPLHHAISFNEAESVRLLLEYRADPNIADKYGNTPLYKTVMENRPEIARALLEKRADPNIADKYGNTPLIQAIMMKYPHFVPLLLQYRANPNIADEYGNTPLYFAKLFKDANIIRQLQQAGGR